MWGPWRLHDIMWSIGGIQNQMVHFMIADYTMNGHDYNQPFAVAGAMVPAAAVSVVADRLRREGYTPTLITVVPTRADMETAAAGKTPNCRATFFWNP